MAASLLSRCDAATRQKMVARARLVDALEPRRHLAATPLPQLNDPSFAQASDAYALTVIPANSTPGEALTNLSLTSLAFSVTQVLNIGSQSTGVGAGKATFGDLTITTPSGSASPHFFEWLHTGRLISSVQIVASVKGTTGIRATYTFEYAGIDGFTQVRLADGSSEDQVTLGYGRLVLGFDRTPGTGDPIQTTGWDVLKNVKYGATGSAAYDSNYGAGREASETVEILNGQQPAVDTSLKFSQTLNIGSQTTGTGAGKADPSTFAYDTVDGVESLQMLASLCSGQDLQNVIYTRRDANNDRAVSRYRLGTVGLSKIAVYDSTRDDQPARLTINAELGQAELITYTNTNTPGSSQTNTAVGWDYVQNVLSSPTSTSAHILETADQRVNAALDSVTFRLDMARTLSLADFTFSGLTTTGLTLTASDANRTWTISGLAAQQTTDATYRVALLADRVNDLTGHVPSATPFIGSAVKVWELDRTAPQPVVSSFAFNGAPPTPYSFDFGFSEPIATAQPDGASVSIRRADTGALVGQPTVTLSPDGVSLDTAFQAFLPDGRYTATLPAGSVRDAVGNYYASDVTISFFVLAGDVNHDATVNFADLLILAKHYGQAGQSFGNGNLDYSVDGKVDFSDLLILARHYGTSLPAAPATSLVAVASTTRKRTSDSAAIGVIG